MDWIFYVLIAVAALIVVLLVRAAAYKPDGAVQNAEPLPPIDSMEVAEHLAGAIRFKTVSYEDETAMDYGEFAGLAEYLKTTYPLVHKTCEREVVGGASLLYRWQGSDPSLMPMALMAHQDVVAPGNAADWKFEPFSGHIDGEYIWGRGTNDIKSLVISELEAVERLIAKGFTPKRDVYLCFGHNEEINAHNSKGAEAIVSLLKSRGVRLDSVLDEGGAVVSGHDYGIRPNVAAIGVAEKGYADITIAVHDKGGHSSTPRNDTGLVRLATVMKRIQTAQFKGRLTGPVTAMFNNVGRYMSFGTRLILANQWLLKPVFKAVLLSRPGTAAMLRTTTAVTMASGSAQPNILPEISMATVNFRILPGETGADVVRHVESVCGDDAKIVSTYISEPSPVSPTDTRAFKLIKSLVPRMGCDAVATEYLVLGGTDSRFYYPICDNVYRFGPMFMSPEVMASAHSVNERLPVSTLGIATSFLMEYIGGYDG